MHKVFIIEKFETTVNGQNVSSNIGIDALLGLAPSKVSEVNKESYGEYLNRRNLIANNSLAINITNTTNNTLTLLYTFDEFNHSAIHTNLFKRSQGYKNVVWLGSVIGFSLGKTPKIEFESDGGQIGRAHV